MSDAARIKQLETQVDELRRRCLALEVRVDAESMQANANFRGLFQDLAITRRGHDESVKALGEAINSHAKSIDANTARLNAFGSAIDGHARAIGAHNDMVMNVSTLTQVLKQIIIASGIADARQIDVAYNMDVSQIDRIVTEIGRDPS